MTCLMHYHILMHVPWFNMSYYGTIMHVNELYYEYNFDGGFMNFGHGFSCRVRHVLMVISTCFNGD